MKKRAISLLTMIVMIIAIIPWMMKPAEASAAEYAMFPGAVLNVTQGAFGEYNSYSHNGQGGYVQNAFDLGSNSNYRAPFSGTITQIKTSYNAVVLQSDEKVYWANGTYDYMSVCLVHDNDISDLYVGKHLNQGDIFYQPGVKDPGGYTTGAHVHICVNVGKTNVAISYFTGDTRPNEAFFLDETTSIIQTGNYSWKTKAHVHNYNTYVWFQKSHPHYKCYQCSCGDIQPNTNEPLFYDLCEECLESARPKNVSLTADNAFYMVGDTATFTFSAVNATNYSLRIKKGEETVKFQTGITSKTQAFTFTEPGTYSAWISACNDYGFTDSPEIYFSVLEGEADPTQFSVWRTILPSNVTETDYDIESKTMYRYRDNTTTTQYGAWGANQTTSTKPTESATLEIVSTTKYYNYYHYCCNYYSGSYNVDSIAYGTGSVYHTYQSTTELSATSVGDMGGRTLYGNHACAKNFLVWAKASPYETYTYTYHTRTATPVTVNGAWSSWQDAKPSTAANRDIEEQTYYRYKLKAHEHTYDEGVITTPATCTAQGVKTFTCSGCGETYTETIPAKGHTAGAAVRENEISATCETAGGYDEAVYCTDCGAELSRVHTDLRALGHDWGEWVYNNDATYDADGTKTRVCRNDPSHTETVTAEGTKLTKPEEPLDPNAPQVTVSNVTARAGDTITVDINIANNPGIVSCKWMIGYDESVLTLTAIDGKDFDGVSFGPLAANPIAVNWDDVLNPNNTSNGAIARLTFTVSENAAAGNTAITVSYDPDDVYDQDYNNVKFAAVNGTVEIVDIFPGDVNGDGKVNNKDLGLLKQYLNGWDVAITVRAADVTGDGKVNNKDLGLLKQYLNGWDVVLG